MRIKRTRKSFAAKTQKSRSWKMRTNARVLTRKRHNLVKKGGTKPPRPNPIPPITTAHHPVDEDEA